MLVWQIKHRGEHVWIVSEHTAADIHCMVFTKLEQVVNVQFRRNDSCNVKNRSNHVRLCGPWVCSFCWVACIMQQFSTVKTL